MTNLPCQHIVAIGASSGGVQEIKRFFDHTSTDGVSYVIVQHLSPDFQSKIVPILSRRCTLKVKKAENKMLVEANHIYVIPNKKVMIIDNGRLQLKHTPKSSAPHLGINTFFDSLAVERKEKAIGVILSGLGSDGSDGAKAIKKAGGMVIARDPSSSEFNNMPSNAIATGAVDYVLEPEFMPEVIDSYIKNNGAPLPQSIESDKETRRSATSFFRDEDAFECIAKQVFPKIIERHKTGLVIKIWVAGCSTGEEAYSLAIILKEQLINEYQNLPIKIFATDIDSVALSHARKGVYDEIMAKRVSPERLEKYFLKEGNNYRISPELRKMLIFAQHDLVKSPCYGNMDFISCRNVLNYVNPILQRKILYILHYGLTKSGYLFLGSTENAEMIAHGLDVVNKDWKIYKNNKNQHLPGSGAFILPALNGHRKAPENFPGIIKYKSLKNNLAEEVNEVLLGELGILSVCIDEYNNIIKTSGNTAKYLLPINFNSNLADLLPATLALAFDKAKLEALQSNAKVLIRGIKDTAHEQVTAVNLLIKPLLIKKDKRRLLMVLFSDHTQTLLDGEGEKFKEEILVTQYTKSLEEDNTGLKKELKSTLEKLHTADENIQALSDSFIAANEEMQSTNEEMQSVNEELHTINGDYELQNRELLQMNDELNNYFRSNLNGQLYVNRELVLIKFSPGTVKHINLLETDIGRPITNISTNIKFETIETDIKEVINKGGVINREIEAKDGRWYQIMTMPYLRRQDDKIFGAMLTFNDISALKNTEQKLDKKIKDLMRVNADLDNFVYHASHDLLGPLSNIEMSIAIIKEIKTPDADWKKLLLVVKSSLKKFRFLLNELAAIGKIENEMREMEPVELNELLREIKSSINNKIDATGTIVICNFEVDCIYFSKKNLRSILYNLISNAIKFKNAARNPHITISTNKVEGFVLLSVKDNGIGIPKNKLEEIFKMHSQLNRNIEGQGLGLYLIKKLIVAAGGNITVESDQDIGSTFTVLLKEDPHTFSGSAW